jgi:acetylornithine deacetylase
MTDISRDIVALASDMIATDSQSFVSNLPLAELVETRLRGFEVERLDWVEPSGVAKRALVARRGRGGLAVSAHMDTVPATGWEADPFAPYVDGGGLLHGLGSADMKGPLAVILTVGALLPAAIPLSLLITTDEETHKEGAKRIARTSALLKHNPPTGIIIAEPTGLRPVRGHRGSVDVVAVATGVQAHSSTGKGDNANWRLLPFLAEMRALQVMLREDPAWQDPAYEPSFCDLNLVIDNHGAAPNVTVGRATAKLKLRFSRSIDARPLRARIAEAADLAGLTVTMSDEPLPPELPADHPLVERCVAATGHAVETAPYGTDATYLQEIAPCVIMGPGSIATAHSPFERTPVRALVDAVPLFLRLAETMAG